MHLYYSIFIFLTLLCYGILLYLSLRKGGRGNRANLLFAVYLLTMVVWQVAYLMVSLSDTATEALFWYRIVVAAVSGQFIVYFAFTQAFLRLEGLKKWVQCGLLVWTFTVILGAVLEQPAIYTGVHRSETTGLFVPTFGPLLPLFVAPNYFFLGYAIYHLTLAHRRSKSSLQRSRIQYLLLGIVIVVLGIAINFIPQLQPYPIDVGANLINALLIAYAILRYQLMDIKLVIRKGLLYFVPTAIIGVCYFFVVYVAVPLFRAVTGQVLLSLVMAALTGVAVQPLVNRAQSWVDRLFFREKYDSTLMLQRLSHTVASVLDLHRLTDMILNSVLTTMHIEKAAFFLKHEESGEFRLMARKGLSLAEPEGLDQGADFRLRKDHPVVNWLSHHEHILTGHDLQLMPQFKALWGQEKAILETLGAELFIPLKAKGDLVGIFAVGPKLSEQPYSQDEQLTLATLANQTAVAIENARLHQETIEEKAKTEIVLQETFGGLVVVDQGLRIVSLNPGAELISGYQAEEVLGKRLTDIFGARITAPDSPLSKAMETGEKVPPVETTLVGKEGVKDILLGVAPLVSGSSSATHYLLSFADISKIKEIERLKSSIIANVSHELRTPLAAIRAHTDLLLEGVEGTDKELRQKWLSVIARHADRLTTLINNFLDLSRLESEHFQLTKASLHLGRVIDDAVALLKVQAQSRRITVELNVQPGLSLLQADEGLIALVVRNLVSNAIKFSPDDSHIRISVWEEGQEQKFSVEDEGIGIPHDAMPYLFTKFFRVPSVEAAAVQGTGLGLALARDAVVAHGGRIEVESTLGKGSRFTVILPKTSDLWQE